MLGNRVRIVNMPLKNRLKGLVDLLYQVLRWIFTCNSDYFIKNNTGLANILVDEDKHKQISLILSRGSTDEGQEKSSKYSEKKHLSIYRKIIRAEVELMTQCLRELLLFQRIQVQFPTLKSDSPQLLEL